MSEERSIKLLLLIFCGTYVVRVIVTAAMFIYSNAVEHVYRYNQTYWLLSVIFLWVIWDSIPLCAMLIIHYKNFTSFSEEEILYSEFSVDDEDKASFLRSSFGSQYVNE